MLATPSVRGTRQAVLGGLVMHFGSRASPCSPWWLSSALAGLFSGCQVDNGAPPLVESSTGDHPGPVRGTTTDFVPVCTPGERRCNNDAAIDECLPTGLEWEHLPCSTMATCCAPPDCPDVRCVGPCDRLEELPSSAGCAFTANRNIHNLPDFPDGIVLGNPSPEGTAHIEIFYVPEGTGDLVPYEALPELWLGPGEITEEGIPLETAFLPGYDSVLRTGGVFRILSDLPIIASQHAPLQANTGNDSSLLLPDTSLGTTYVVATYGSAMGQPSYATIVALEDDTEITWSPKIWPTGGNGLPVPPVGIGDTATMRLNRFETLQLVPSDNDLPPDPWMADTVRDVSGTVIRSTHPIWVLGGARLAVVPLSLTHRGTADPLQEVLFPVEHWGTRYVSASPPSRYEPEPQDTEAEASEPQESLLEHYYLRLFAGQDTVTIESSEDHPAFPVTLDEIGDFVEVEIPIATNMVLSANRKFLPVQYQRSRTLNFPEGAPEPDVLPVLTRGDSAMAQLVPVDQFLERYTFATGVGFAFNYVQVTRAIGGAPILLRSAANTAPLDITIDGYAAVDEAFEVATVRIPQGGYEIWSDDPFGIIQSGSTLSKNGIDYGCAQNDGGPEGLVQQCNATYAYPGGMRAKEIIVP